MAQNTSEEDIENVPYSDPNSPILTGYRVSVPALDDGLALGTLRHEQRLLDFLKATPSVQWIKKINLCSPLIKFRLASSSVRGNLHAHFIRTISWGSVFTVCKKWLKHPMNIALLIWLLCVGAAGAMLILLLLGLLNDAFPSKSLRN